ncbi:MAG: hypothetical protein HOH73_01190 [Alphaproteobacteria bacterium]|jgi:exodeoxyribonuclease III|nr:hypothetical protein [Alphaproteobacteria bacterium]
MFRKKNKPYHIDYIFAGKYWLDRVNNISVGSYEGWIDYSDHMPLIVNFKSS